MVFSVALVRKNLILCNKMRVNDSLNGRRLDATIDDLVQEMEWPAVGIFRWNPFWIGAFQASTVGRLFTTILCSSSNVCN